MGRKVQRVVQSTEELRAHLQDQLRFLEKSAADFDAGDMSEAKRLALGLRLLLHDSGKSKSLLGQLDLKDKLFYDTCDEYDPRSLTSFDGSLVMVASTAGSHYEAPLDGVPFPSKKPFERWWTKAFLVDTERTQFSRAELVLAVANQDGGGHVDPAIEEAYWKLSRNNSLGWVRKVAGSDIPMESPIPTAIRQIAHEVITTLRDRIPAGVPEGENGLLFPRPIEPDHPSKTGGPRPGRNDPCYCGSGLKFKKCHGAAQPGSA